MLIISSSDHNESFKENVDQNSKPANKLRLPGLKEILEGDSESNYSLQPTSRVSRVSRSSNKESSKHSNLSSIASEHISVQKTVKDISSDNSSHSIQ